jgi:glutathione S-transferase
MTPIITAYDRSPDGGKGLARDTRVRWALEEVGQEYDVKFVSMAGKTEPDHLRLSPFGRIPVYEDGDLVLFESGAIIHHIAEQHPGTLLPEDPAARARATMWMFAAVNTVEPPIHELGTVQIAEGDRSWATERTPLVHDRIRDVLGQLADTFGDSEWLEDTFTAGDLMMVSVLQRARPAGLLDEFPSLAAYAARAEARPAYERAFATQYAVNAR